MSNRKEKRAAQFAKNNLELVEVLPKTENQRLFLEANTQHLVAHGSTGTGKTFLAMYRALKQLEQGEQEKLVIVRSAVPTREIGFLPGTEKEKGQIYERPYHKNASKLYARGDAYEILKAKGTIEFILSSFVRGDTLDDSIILVDECQNMTFHEVESIFTRVGENCKIFFCGDWMQADLPKNGIVDFYNVLRRMPEFTFVEFSIDDIVRNELIKSYFKTKIQVLGHESSLK